MDISIVIFILIALTIMALVGFIVFKKKKADEKDPVGAELRRATREYETKVRSAERVVVKAESKWKSEVSKAKKSLIKAEQLPSVPLTSYTGAVGNFVLRGESIEVSHGTFSLNNDVHASVDTAGNLATKSRPTLTRMSAGGLLLGPVGILAGGMFKKSKAVDNRELYLMIEGSDFATLIQAKPNEGPRLRELAMSINNAAKSVGTFKKECELAVSSARSQLAAVEADRSSIDQAVATVAAAKSDRVRLDAAECAISSRS